MGDQLVTRDLPCTEESINDPERGHVTDPIMINTMLAIAEIAKAVNLPDRHYGDIGEFLVSTLVAFQTVIHKILSWH